METASDVLRRTVLIAFAVGIVVAAVALVVSRAGRARATATAAADLVTAQLVAADALLGLGAMEAARTHVVAAAEAARSEHDHLRVLRRAYAVPAADMEGWEWRYQLASAAHDSIPGSPAIQQTVAHAALRTGRAAEALAVVESTGGAHRESSTFQFLAAEALVATGAHAETLGGSSTGDRAELEARLTPDLLELVAAPSSRDPETLVELGKRFSLALIQDAALIHASRGNLSEASDLYERHLSTPAYHMAGFLIAYDAARLEVAESRLSSHRALQGDQALTLQLAADLALQLGRSADAAALYQRTTAVQPEFAWQPYLNLARLHSDAGDLVEALNVLAKALPLFPERVALTVAAARIYETAGRFEDRDALVARAAETLAAVDAPLIDLELAILELRGPALGADRLSGSLWQMAEAHPEHVRLQRVLATRVLSAGDLSRTMVVLRRVERGGATPPAWWHELSGVVAALQGRLPAAARALGRARDEDAQTWTTPYNLAIALAAAGLRDRARGELEEAERRLRVFGNLATAQALDTRQATAIIRTRLGEIHWHNGDLVAARRDLEFAAELDPGSTRARVLINRLVAAGGS